MYKQQWNLIKEAFNGDGGFKNGSYILQYSRESQEKLRDRRQIAYYPNIINSKVKRYIAYLFKKKPLRLYDDEILHQIISDINKRTQHLDTFMQDFCLNTKLRGCNIILVDNSSSFSSSLKEQKEKRQFPYLVEILPERVEKYKLDNYGNFEYISYKDTINKSSYEKEEIINIIRYFDKTKHIVYDEFNNILEQYEHNLGLCPLVYLSETGYFPCVGEFTQLGNIAKRYYNLKSELDELLRGQTFSILAIQSLNKSPKIDLGTNNALVYDGANPPLFLSPSIVPTQSYQVEISKIEDLISKITYDINTNNQAESGIALDIKFQGLNSSLSSFSLQVEDFEKKVFKIINTYLQKEININIKYPDEFNILDINQQIDTLSAIKQIANIPKYESLKLSQIIKNDLQNIEQEELNEILSQLEDNQKENTY